MVQAIQAYESITVDKNFIELERLRDKTRRDESQALYSAEMRGAAKRDEHWEDVLTKTVSKKDKQIQNLLR